MSTFLSDFWFSTNNSRAFKHPDKVTKCLKITEPGRRQTMFVSRLYDLFKALCPVCDFTVPMLKAYSHYGPPICPKDKLEMDAVGDWGGVKHG